jgi:hypothetical protein
MRKATVTFEITETKTEATVIGIDGIAETMDITDTKAEKSFRSLLKKLRELKLSGQIIRATDINSWEES